MGTTESQAKGDSTESQANAGLKKRLITVIFFLCILIVVILLPFYLDYPSWSRSGNAKPPTQAPTEPPSDESMPEPTLSPLAKSPTEPPSDAPTTLQWGQFLNSFL